MTGLFPGGAPLKANFRRYAARLLGRLALLWAGTWRVNGDSFPVQGPCINAFWHENIFIVTTLHRHLPIVAVVSRSSDGDMLAEILADYGYGLIRGSTSQGAFSVIREGLRSLRQGRMLAIALDGPRGPAHVPQPGAEALARKEGLPLVLTTVETGGIRLRTWDRFRIPLPFARVQLRYRCWSPDDGPLNTWLVDNP
ncbi:MAG TPA: DUF374 domain-containing protein [Myxococcota bacterium]|nr:DUF374 domain-containing protein [Myxococcota bacterium]